MSFSHQSHILIKIGTFHGRIRFPSGQLILPMDPIGKSSDSARIDRIPVGSY